MESGIEGGHGVADPTTALTFRPDAPHPDHHHRESRSLVGGGTIHHYWTTPIAIRVLQFVDNDDNDDNDDDHSYDDDYDYDYDYDPMTRA
ncbi:hypothetical protein V1477_003141, partial [Vespula maculifrons]